MQRKISTMIMPQDLLIEIGTEELPPHNLQNLADTFASTLSKQLTAANFSHQAQEIKKFASPRRLAVIIPAVANIQTEQTIERRGPPLNKAYDENKQATQTTLGFAKSCGVDVTQLSTIEFNNNKYLFFSYTKPGLPLATLLPDIIQSCLTNLTTTSKPMRWGNSPESFVRPIRWMVVLYGNTVINATVFGVQTSNITYGHRFHHPEALILNNPNEYEDKLFSKGQVISDFIKRRDYIYQEIINITQTINQDNPAAIIDPIVLNEVTGMVEFPVALLGSFSEDFLNLPSEVLLSVMKIHQKCFPIKNNKNQLLPYFIIISNIKSKNTLRVINNNQSVMHARLSDADFFYQSDKKNNLTSYLEKLEHVLFQDKLGSMLNKAKRIENLAGLLGAQDSTLAKRAGLLAKADLLTKMVGEFPELSGTMGYYYAKNSGESESVALAIKEHYLPRFAGDALPQTHLGCIVSMADRLDTLVSLFSIQQIPTGEKDPFALRRAALGLLRIIIEKNYDFDLCELINYNTPAFENLSPDIKKQILNFILERLRAWYIEQGVRADVFAAVYACYPTRPLDFHRRIQAVNLFLQSSSSKTLISVNKRVNNILKKSELEWNSAILPDSNLFEEPSEQELNFSLNNIIQKVKPLYKNNEYTEILNHLITLQKPLDYFFENTLVLVDNKKIRDNRLALLNQLHGLFLKIADISLLQQE